MDKAPHRCHRRGVLAAILAGAGLLAAACGGGSSPALTAQTAYQKSLAYSQCMRSHGLSGMADPVVSATGISMQMPAGAKPNSPVFQAAQRACRKLIPGGPP